MTNENGWEIMGGAPDEGDTALSLIFYQVQKLRGLVVQDPLDETTDRLEAIKDAAELLRAYISGLKARRG